NGAQSIQLWKANRAPRLWREMSLPPNGGGSSAALAITKVVYEGVRDDVNPNNEFVEITLDARFAQSASLSGYSLRGDASGLNFAFPSGITLTAAQPVLRVYTGSGTNDATTVYLGRAAGIWSNTLQNDCARLVSPNGGQYRISLGGSCPIPVNIEGISPLL